MLQPNELKKKLAPDIFTKPDWINIILHDSYTVSFGVFADQVIVITPVGDCKEKGMLLLLNKLDAVLAEMNLLNEKRFYLWDYAQVVGLPPLSARKQLTDYMVKERDAGRVLGFFGCNTPLIIKFIGNTTARFYKVPFPVDFSFDLESGLRNALACVKKDELIDN